jgi:cytochrome o ubiquinol oxidase subunit 1
LIFAALLSLLWQLQVSIKNRDQNRVFVGDPWAGRSLEWASSAPPPEYNFAVIPVVEGRDAFTTAKEQGRAYLAPETYTDIQLPKNSALGPAIAVIGFALAFGLVWQVWWLVVAMSLALTASLIIRGFARDTARIIPAQEVRRKNERWLDAAAQATAISRADESNSVNVGLALQAADGGVP